MKISKETVDNLKYIDILLSNKEVNLLNDYVVLSGECYVNGELINFGIKKDLIDERIIWEGGF